MKSVLRQLYDGEINPMEDCMPALTSYRELRREHLSLYESFVEELEPSQRKKFLVLMDQMEEFAPLEVSEMFLGGFRLGVRMMAEVFETPRQE